MSDFSMPSSFPLESELQQDSMDTLVSVTTINNLPVDVLEYICSYLCLEDLLHVALTNKHLLMGVTPCVQAKLLLDDFQSDHLNIDHVIRLPQQYCLVALRVVGGPIYVGGNCDDDEVEVLGYTQPPLKVVQCLISHITDTVCVDDVPEGLIVCDCLHMCFIRACEQGSLDVVKILLQETNVNPGHYKSTGILTAARNNRIDVYKYLIADGRSDPSLQGNMAIGDCSARGYSELVGLLLQDERVDPGFMNSYPLWRAAKTGRVEVVRLLIASEKVNPGDDRNVAIRCASEEGFTEIVKLLLALPHERGVDPGAENGYCLRKACEYGHTQTVKLLLADMRVDPSADNNAALLIACERNNPAIVHSLLQVPTVDPAHDHSLCLVLACKSGYLPIVILLLNDGRVDANDRSRYALKAAITRKHKEVAKLVKAYIDGGTNGMQAEICKARWSIALSTPATNNNPHKEIAGRRASWNEKSSNISATTIYALDLDTSSTRQTAMNYLQSFLPWTKKANTSPRAREKN